jgi:hypothetical protein
MFLKHRFLSNKLYRFTARRTVFVLTAYLLSFNSKSFYLFVFHLRAWRTEYTNAQCHRWFILGSIWASLHQDYILRLLKGLMYSKLPMQMTNKICKSLIFYKAPNIFRPNSTIFRKFLPNTRSYKGSSINVVTEF